MSLFGTGKSRKKEKCQDSDLYPLVEMELCPCNVFISQPYGNWSDCIIPEGRIESQRGGFRVQGESKECGKGMRFRAIACSDKNGRPVDPSYCSSSGKEYRWEHTQPRRCIHGLELVALFFKNCFISPWSITHYLS